MMTGLCVNAAAQDRPVSGLVLDASTGEPLAGASVYAADSRAGTITDSGGHFALSIPGKCKELEIAFIGYEKQVVAVSPASTYFEVLMKSSSVEIDQVIVIGYGTAKKSDLTGSVSSIGSKDLVKSAPVSLEKGLQGRISGVNVVQNDGAPGSGISVQIRGTNSFLGGTEPLYVVDGIPITTSNDQESINFEGNTYSYRFYHVLVLDCGKVLTVGRNAPFHAEAFRKHGLHFCHVLLVQLPGSSRFPVRPVENHVCMVIRLMLRCFYPKRGLPRPCGCRFGTCVFRSVPRCALRNPEAVGVSCRPRSRQLPLE